MKRPVMYPHEDCLEHWSPVPCLGCLYDAPDWRRLRPYAWGIRQRLRAVYYRLFARIEYRAEALSTNGEEEEQG